MITIFALLMLAAPEDAARAEAWAKKAKTVAECVGQDDCTRKWNAAKSWVAENTRFKIVVDQEDVYSTPGAIYANTDLSFTLKRETKGDGYVIKLRAWCGNAITCKPKPKSAERELSAYLRGVGSTPSQGEPGR